MFLSRIFKKAREDTKSLDEWEKARNWALETIGKQGTVTIISFNDKGARSFLEIADTLEHFYPEFNPVIGYVND